MALSYEISLEAEEDWYNITRYTLKNFGERQVQKYTDSLLKCSDDLANAIGLKIIPLPFPHLQYQL